MTIRLHGVEAIREMIRRHVELTERLAVEIDKDERFEIVAPHPLNLLCIRAVAGDAVTDELIERANATGQVLLTRTVLDGRSVLRISIGSRATEWTHVESLWRLLQSLHP